MTNQYSPAMQQYVDIKNLHPDKIIFFRLGDFYEFFFEDAITCSKLLDLVLTKKKAGNGNLVDMAGIPHHAHKEYAKKLVEQGYKVAIVEQMENPSEVKGIVRREIVEVITPATISLEQNVFESSYLAAISQDITKFDVYYFDIITNQVLYSNLDDIETLLLELNTLNIKEIVVNFSSKTIDKYAKDNQITKTIYKNKKYTRAYEMGINYMKEILNVASDLFDEPTLYKSNDNILLTKSTIENLEIFKNDVKNNLFSTINNTQTMMGARLLSSSLRRPFKNLQKINKRLDEIQFFYDNTLQRMEILNLLKNIFDLDRLHTRLMLNKLTPRGILKLKESIILGLKIAQICDNNNFSNLKNLIELIEQSIINVEEITNERYINPTYSESLKNIFIEANASKQWLINYEQNLKNKYNFKSLKIGFNKIFGYYIEISKVQAKDAPEFFIRKQTLVNNERFITEEMKEKESLILNSEANYINKQLEIFTEITALIQTYSEEISLLSKYIANIDLVCSNAQLAKQLDLVKPNFTNECNVIGSRHLTIEALIGKNNFVSNDFNFTDKNIIILTGPNMSGKSTYMRQIAITQIMAQSGLYVAAQSANLEIVDQIFTRIGAGDDLSSGKSTFLVEMEETSYALKNATDNSLIILDELGRGTSTYDGLSIAFGVIKYINDNLKAKTLLATHYHELTTLNDVLENSKNMTIDVEEINNKVVFKHKIITGRAQKSYGIHVAKIAKINEQVLQNAKVFLHKLEQNSQVEISNEEICEINTSSLPKTELENELLNIDVNSLTPLEALMLLSNLQKKVKND